MSAGFDNVSIEIIKLSIKYIVEPLSHLVKNSFEWSSTRFLKIARVCPIFKSGNNADFINFRPISVLPSFSKIFEKLFYNRLLNYLSQDSILSVNQYGFRNNHDTSMALLEMIDKITNARDSNAFSIGIFIDLSNGFDTLNHNILFDKLEHDGIRGVVLQWFKSYLHNRPQYVVYNGWQSAKFTIKCGIPHGSILGPILFLNYINDITNVFRLLLFADDTNIFMEHRDIEAHVTRINSELVKLADWFPANRLFLNVSKTNFIIFRSSKKKYNPTLINISLNAHQITQIYTKFLGVYIDERLNWEEQFKQLSTKLSKNIGVLLRLKLYLTTKLLHLVYNSLILPYLAYCNLIWTCASPGTIKKIVTLEKKL